MLATTLAAASALWLAAGLMVLGRRQVGYSHLKHTISELGEIGSPQQKIVAYGLFWPVGLLSLAAALATKGAPGAAYLGFAVATGYLVAAVFPCDRGSPLSGSVRQAVHNIGGAVQYVGGAVAIFAMAQPLGQAFRGAGFAMLAATVAISLLPSNSVRGAIQRVAEAILFACLVHGTYTVRHSAA